VEGVEMKVWEVGGAGRPAKSTYATGLALLGPGLAVPYKNFSSSTTFQGISTLGR